MSNLVKDSATTQESKGTLLLIHGTAPQNIDGQLPVARVQALLKEKDPTHYIVQPTYRDLAKELNALGWDTVRYTRLGVHQDHVDEKQYAKTDLRNIMDQLKTIWSELPKDKPRIAFAWSGGSVHILQLPLADASAIVILGGISTKRTDVMRLRAKNKEELDQIEKEMNARSSAEGKVSRTEMVGLDMPYGRFWDENHLKDNWTYLKPYPKLPVLILHGDQDEEASVKQALVWKEKLPNHDITLRIKPSGNHAFGTLGNQPDMPDLAKTIHAWLAETVTR